MEKTFKERLIELRERHDLSQRKLAELMEVEQATISRWESGASEARKRQRERLSQLESDLSQRNNSTRPDGHQEAEPASQKMRIVADMDGAGDIRFRLTTALRMYAGERVGIKTRDGRIIEIEMHNQVDSVTDGSVYIVENGDGVKRMCMLIGASSGRHHVITAMPAWAYVGVEQITWCARVRAVHYGA